jgi:hypothetical protein
MILFLDQRPWLAGAWALFGGITGVFGLKALQPFVDPLLEWYRRRNPDARLRQRLFRLIREGKADTEEFKRCIAEERFWMCLPLPPLFGLFHGLLLGTTIGVLCGFDPESGISASAGAALGLIIGPVLVATLAGLTLACIVDVDKELPLPVRLARRGLVVVSPLLIVPALGYCLWRIFRSA